MEVAYNHSDNIHHSMWMNGSSMGMDSSTTNHTNNFYSNNNNNNNHYYYEERTDMQFRSLDSYAPEDESDGWDTLAKATSNALLFLLIFGMSATVDMKTLIKQLNNKFAILTGVCMQFVVMPLLGYIAVVSLRNSGLNTPMGLTLLIVTTSPGGSYSNWWCSVFNADLALSVAMTALSTLLSTFLLPANLALYGHLAYGVGHNGGHGEDDDGEAKGDHVLENVDFSTLFVSLGVVISAIFTGLYSSYRIKSASFRRWANRFGTFAGITLILFSALLSSFITGADQSGEEGEGEGGGATPIWEQHWSFFVGVAMPCAFGLVIANLLSRFAGLSKPETVTVSVECCYQNVGIATSAAVAMFDDPIDRADALSVPLLYGLLEAVVLGLYCVWAWKVGWTKAPKDEDFCTMISNTYEIDEDDEIEEMDVMTRFKESYDPSDKKLLRQDVNAVSSKTFRTSNTTSNNAATTTGGGMIGGGGLFRSKSRKMTHPNADEPNNDDEESDIPPKAIRGQKTTSDPSSRNLSATEGSVPQQQQDEDQQQQQQQNNQDDSGTSMELS